MDVSTVLSLENSHRLELTGISRSLADLAGEAYVQSVCAAQAFLHGAPPDDYLRIAHEQVEFFPDAYRARLDALVDSIGDQVCAPQTQPSRGAGSAAFNQATHLGQSPLSGLGFIRVGEDGKAYLVSKSEHYHASLGHAFPGYRLVENARRLGIPNATHNNTRGGITRVLEQELVRAANGIPKEDDAGLQRVLDSNAPQVLNRILNLETGSLAVEAGLKMMLARFYRLEDTSSQPKYNGRIPVFLVIADRAGGKKANYHGTTLFTQFMRGLWPELYQGLEKAQLFQVAPVGINNLAEFKSLLEEYDRPPYKVAGFFHEIVLMNYGAIRMSQDFLHQAYDLCRTRDVPILVDEIQSCIWSPELFLFREYGLQPDFVSLGKGFPGGEFPASRILFTAEMDNLNQFGALVTNGQEELASLAYLVTMQFIQANRGYVAELGDQYAAALQDLARRYPDLISEIEGYRHLSSIFFHRASKALEFIHLLNQAGIDISAQTYKADCPPAALTKLPVITTYKALDFLIANMDAALKTISK